MRGYPGQSGSPYMGYNGSMSPMGSPVMMVPMAYPQQQPAYDFGGGPEETNYLNERGAMLDLLSGS